MNPAFTAAYQAGTNLATAREKASDSNAIESILSQAMQSGDPAVLQNSIGKILSQVSPERQGVAIKVLENAYNNVQKKEAEKQQFERERQAGVTPGIHHTIQAQQLKDKAKAQRLSEYGLGNQQQNSPVQNKNIPTPQMSAQPSPVGNVSESVFKRLSDDQLVVASGAPDREISDPAKAELKRRDEERNLSQKKDEGKIKRHTDISQDIIKENEKSAQDLVQTESALNLMENAIVNKDMSFFSPDNLAEITGIEGLRSKEGALFKTSGKEFFLGSITRAGARPNQFIETQIVDMLPKIGRSTAANLGVARAFRNEIDLKKEKVRLTRELADELETKLGYVPRNIGQIRDEKLKDYAEKKQREFNNDLRAIKAIDEKSSQPFLKVEAGTPVSKVVAQALLLQFKNDPNKAAEEAKKLGYSF